MNEKAPAGRGFRTTGGEGVRIIIVSANQYGLQAMPIIALFRAIVVG
jgi:hypothetical protein